MKPALLVVLGPTGVGKTATALPLAEFFHSPILNADSRQLYRDLPIGTAAPTPAEQRRAKHYFVGTLGLQEQYSAARYEADALRLLEKLFHERDVVLLSGGSMMYVDAVCRGLDDIPTIDEETRRFVLRQYEARGLDYLLAQLSVLDPAYYAEVDRRNTRRVLHALEVCLQSGRPFSAFRTHTAKPRPFRVVKIGLDRPRAELFDRINRRADAMLADGLLAEARRVLPYRDCEALNTVGYKEIFRYLDGEWTLDFAVARWKKNTRVYAKKQLTWWRRDPDVRWFSPDDFPAILAYARSQVAR